MEIFSVFFMTLSDYRFIPSEISNACIDVQQVHKLTDTHKHQKKKYVSLINEFLIDRERSSSSSST